MNTSELMEIIADNEIAIYGAGYAAQNFYTALQIRNLQNQVKYFIVTDLEKTHREVHGVPVRALKDVVNEENIYICIAVHEAVKNEIEEYLLQSQIEKYVWVHPNIMEIALGEPLEHHKQTEVRKIIQQNSYDNYAFAIRYLAIENYYEKNTIGYDVYLKALYLQCEAQTAQKRLNNFISLIDDWDKNGYRQDRDILIDEKKRLIDGTHRLSLACYHEMEYMYCDVFPYSDKYDKVVKKNHFLSMDMLKKNGFLPYELEAIQKVQSVSIV